VFLSDGVDRDRTQTQLALTIQRATVLMIIELYLLGF